MKAEIFFLNNEERNTDTIAEQHHNNRSDRLFVTKIRQRLTGSELVFDGFEAAVVGGRKSIASAFGEEPCAEWRFSAPPGQLIYASYERSSALRSKGIKVGMNRTAQLATGPMYNAVGLLKKFAKQDMQAQRANGGGPHVGRMGVVRNQHTNGANWARFGESWNENMADTYSRTANRKLFKAVNDSLKTRTVLYLFAASHDFDGRALATSTTGAGLCLLIRQFFGV